MLEPSDSELIKQCLEGDNIGFDALVKRYQKRVFGYCYKMLGDADQASDAAQESFVKAYHALGSFKLGAELLPWLLRIANNTSIDHARSRTRKQTGSLDEFGADTNPALCSDESPEKSLLQAERTRLAREAVLELPTKHRSVLVMFYFDAMSVKQISQALDRPEGTVKYDLHTAREMLRHKLEGVVVEV